MELLCGKIFIWEQYFCFHFCLAFTRNVSVWNKTVISKNNIELLVEFDFCTSLISHIFVSWVNILSISLKIYAVIDFGKFSFCKKKKIMLSFCTCLFLSHPFKNGTWRSLPDDLKRRVEPFKSFSSVSRMSENVFGDKPLRITVRQVRGENLTVALLLIYLTRSRYCRELINLGNKCLELKFEIE